MKALLRLSVFAFLLDCSMQVPGQTMLTAQTQEILLNFSGCVNPRIPPMASRRTEVQDLVAPRTSGPMALRRA
jgi:hypothetical protein